MDCRTGEIHRFADEVALKDYQEKTGRPLAPLTPGQARKLETFNANQRKNWMRNKPCVCGSGRKFKRCCWGDYA